MEVVGYGHGGLSWLVLVLALSAGCGESHEPGRMCPDHRESFTLELIGPQLEDASGRMAGVDLDGRTSDASDPQGCFHPDWEDPVDEGGGVDNAFGALWATSPADPTFPAGQRLAFEIGGLDPDPEYWADSDCTVMRLADLAPAPTFVEAARFRASFEGVVMVTVDAETGWTLPLRDPVVEASLDFTDLELVAVAGKLMIDEVVDATRAFAPDVDPALVRTTFEGVGDLEPDSRGECQAISAAFAAVEVR